MYQGFAVVSAVVRKEKTELLRWSVSGNVKWKNQSPRVFLSPPACVESVFQWYLFVCV